ncbi:MAG: hypothetical protein ACREFX_15500 [Opitutaceae bacterium]
MWRRFIENLFTVIVIVAAICVVGGVTLSRYVQSQKQALAPLEEQNEALRSQIDQNRRDVEATTQILRQAVSHPNGGIFNSDEELVRMNTARMNALADAIAQRVRPKLPAPKSADDLARQEDRQIDRISSATAQKLQPAIADLAQAQHNANGRELASAQAETQRLKRSLASTEKAANDALLLTQRLSALYLDTYRDKGALVHLISIPADLIQYTASGDIITGSRGRAREQKRLDGQIAEIQQRLDRIRTQAGQPAASEN